MLNNQIRRIGGGFSPNRDLPTEVDLSALFLHRPLRFVLLIVLILLSGEEAETVEDNSSSLTNGTGNNTVAVTEILTDGVVEKLKRDVCMDLPDSVNDQLLLRDAWPDLGLVEEGLSSIFGYFIGRDEGFADEAGFARLLLRVHVLGREENGETDLALCLNICV